MLLLGARRLIFCSHRLDVMVTTTGEGQLTRSQLMGELLLHLSWLIKETRIWRRTKH